MSDQEKQEVPQFNQAQQDMLFRAEVIIDEAVSMLARAMMMRKVVGSEVGLVPQGLGVADFVAQELNNIELAQTLVQYIESARLMVMDSTTGQPMTPH